ncbi:MAG: hypothetical protein JSR80_04245 [Verrucomicrobia bacterium]|nr:hypothetical protein [Verrucomicrobiota bacterium]
MTDIRPISSNSCSSSLVLPSMALLTTLFMSRALQFTKKSTTLLCLSAFTVTWIATSACTDSPPPREEEETDPTNSYASHEVEEPEESGEDTKENEKWSPWANDLLLKLKEMGLISAVSYCAQEAKFEEILNKYADYPLSTYAIQKAVSTLILQLYFKTEETPQARYLTCEEGLVYPGYTLPPLVFTEEQLLNMNTSIVEDALEENYVCFYPQGIWLERDQAPHEITSDDNHVVSDTPPQDFFEQKLRSAGVQITEEIKNFLGSNPDLNTQKDRAQLSELIWGNTTKKHILEYNFLFDSFCYPVWDYSCPPLLDLEDLFNLTPESLLYLKNHPPCVQLHIKNELLHIDRTLMMPLHVAADFLTKLFPHSPRDYSLMGGGEISFLRSKDAMQSQYAGELVYGEWVFREEERSGYWPLKILK